MDWDIFWSAFGAIGTTLGSLITAGAVVVAVKQYRQPITKLIQVGFNLSLTTDMNGNLMELYTLSVKNRGVRPVTIDAIYAKGYKRNLFMNLLQSKFVEYKTFPIDVQPEECVNFYFEATKFREELRKMIQEGYMKKGQKFVVFTQDSLGDVHCYNTKAKVKGLIK